MNVRIDSLFRYPVKGLSPEPLDDVTLCAGASVPHDRRFALAHSSSRRMSDHDGGWVPKGHLLQLMSYEKLATLRTRFEPGSGLLTILRNGRRVARGNVTETAGRSVIEQFFAAYMGQQVRGAPRLIECGDQAFSDSPEPFVSLVSLASVRDLERVVGRPVDPMRFRANILIDGVPAWTELSWVGRRLVCGDAELRVEERTGRCAATNVDPATGVRNMTLPHAMSHAYGHQDCGLYARVVRGGTISKGAEFRIVD